MPNPNARTAERGWWIDDDGFLRHPDNIEAYDLDDCVSLLDSRDNAHEGLAAQNRALRLSLEETLKCLEQHLDESCRDHNLKHRDDLCPCNGNEVVRARAALAGE